MAQRSTGMFPREKFDLDANFALTTSAVTQPVTLANVKTIRVIVVGAAGIDNAGTNKVSVDVGNQVIVFNAQDLDLNGVGIAHVRGALCDGDNQAFYTLGGGASVAGVFLDMVDNVG